MLALAERDDGVETCKWSREVKVPRRTKLLLPFLGNLLVTFARRASRGGVRSVVVPIQSLNPDVLMMKSAEDWY